MNSIQRKYQLLPLIQILAIGLILVFSPCSVRNSVQESLGLEQTGVTNKSKATNHLEELCLTLEFDATGDHPTEIINTTPDLPSFGTLQNYQPQTKWEINTDLSLSQYEAPYTVKDKTPLYLLYQQFKTHLLSV